MPTSPQPELFRLMPRKRRGSQAEDRGALGMVELAYAYAVGIPIVESGCVRLEPDAQLDHNPFNSERFAEPRVLCRVIEDYLASAPR